MLRNEIFCKFLQPFSNLIGYTYIKRLHAGKDFSMNSRGWIFLVVGLVIGSVLGVLGMSSTRPDRSAEITELQNANATLAASVAVVGTPVMRTVNEAAEVSNFYIIPFDQAETWLTDTLEVEMPETVIPLFAAVPNDVADQLTLDSALENEESNTTLVLQFVYEQLLPKRPEDSSDPISTCLAIENDIYAGTSVKYLYVQVPTANAKDMGFPATTETDGWRLLEGPLSSSEIWSTGCFVPEEEPQQ
jgi:hypothetical protein